MLDLSLTVDSYLHKTLLKSKSITGSRLLPEHVKAETKQNRGSLQELSAIGNVTARLYNTKLVKEAMSHILGSINALLGISNEPPTTSATAGNEASETSAPEHNAGEEPKSADNRIDTSERTSSRNHSLAEHPGDDEKVMELAPKDHDFYTQPAVESEDLSRFDAVVGVSSDEESTGEVDKAATSGRPSPDMDISQQLANASSLRSQSWQSISPPPKPRNTTKQAQKGTSKSGSTFLPTLMGGYWSGSESATDEEDKSTRKKNRPGQQARRALWEKKFGSKANHLKGQASRRSRDKDWDPKRGARSENERRFRGGRTGGRGSESLSVNGKARTGENAVAVKPRGRGMGRKDDTGPLHPSWEAAKKAKEAKQTASFQGKKVVFE